MNKNYPHQNLTKAQRAALASLQIGALLAGSSSCAIEALTEYRRLRKGFPVSILPHPTAIIDLAITQIPKHVRLTRIRLHHLIGGSNGDLDEAYSYAVSVINACTPDSDRYDTSLVLAQWLSDLISTDRPVDQNVAELINLTDIEPSLCAYILNLADMRVRFTAALSLFLLAREGCTLKKQRCIIYLYGRLDGYLKDTSKLSYQEEKDHLERAIFGEYTPATYQSSARSYWYSMENAIDQFLHSCPGAASQTASLRIPFPELCRMSAPSANRELARRANAEVLRRFLAVASGDPYEILAQYRSLTYGNRTSEFVHPEEIIDVLAIVAKVDGFDYKVLASLLGTQSGLPAVYDGLCARLNVLPSTQSKSSFIPDTGFYSWIKEMLGCLPETCLHEGYADIDIWPLPREAARVMSIGCLSVRLLAGISLLLMCAQGFRGESRSAVLRKFVILDDLFTNNPLCGDTDRPIDINVFVQTIALFLSEDDHSPYFRRHTFATWSQKIAEAHAYMQRYPNLATRYWPWALILDKRRFGKRLKQLANLSNATRRSRRERSCAPIAECPSSALARAETQLAEIYAIRRDFDFICDQIKAGEVDLIDGFAPFSVTLPHPALSQSDRDVITLDFAVVTRAHLGSLVPGIAHANENVLSKDRLFLQYLGPREEKDWRFTLNSIELSLECSEPPILAMYRAGVFFNPEKCGAGRLKYREMMMPRSDWTWRDNSYYLFKFISSDLSRIATSCLAKDIVIIPIHELCFAAAVNRAVMRCLFKGARIGEIVQQKVSPESFELVLQKGDHSIWQYKAIAKMRLEPEEYFIDGVDMESILEIVKCAKHNGWSFEVIEAAHKVRHKCEPAKYLYQRDGRGLSPGEIGLSLSVFQWPNSPRSHDFRHGIARYLRSAGVSREEIATFLHHDIDTLSDGFDSISGPAGVGVYVEPTFQSRLRIMELLAQNLPKGL